MTEQDQHQQRADTMSGFLADLLEAKTSSVDARQTAFGEILVKALQEQQRREEQRRVAGGR